MLKHNAIINFMEHFDFILAGGGAAGLGLAYYMVNSPLKDHSILIIDKEAKNKNDRTLVLLG